MKIASSELRLAVAKTGRVFLLPGCRSFAPPSARIRSPCQRRVVDAYRIDRDGTHAAIRAGDRRRRRRANC